MTPGRRPLGNMSQHTNQRAVEAVADASNGDHTLTSRVDRNTHTRVNERESACALAISATYGYASERSCLLVRVASGNNETLRACDRVLRWRACEHLCEAFLMSIFVTVLTIQ